MNNVVTMRRKASIARDMLEKLDSGSSFDEVVERANSDPVAARLLLREAATEIVNYVLRSTFQ